MNVIGIVGSLRRGSYNAAVLRAAIELAPAGMSVAQHDLAHVPLYNADVDSDELRPPAAQALREAIGRADGLLIAMPEYNHTVPGVLQNAIDWASRPAFKSSLADKPVAIVGASAGPVGTARGQQHLKLTLMSTLSLIMPHTGVIIANAAQKVEEGRLTDQPTREFLRSFLLQFDEWIRRVQR